MAVPLHPFWATTVLAVSRKSPPRIVLRSLRARFAIANRVVEFSTFLEESSITAASLRHTRCVVCSLDELIILPAAIDSVFEASYLWIVHPMNSHPLHADGNLDCSFVVAWRLRRGDRARRFGFRRAPTADASGWLGNRGDRTGRTRRIGRTRRVGLPSVPLDTNDRYFVIVALARAYSLTDATTDLTRSKEVCTAAFSVSSNGISMIRSTPPAPITTGTPR